MGLDTIAGVFKAISNVGHSLPVDAVLGGFEPRRNMVRRYADDFKQPFQSQSQHSIVGEHIFRNAAQSLFDGANR